MADTLIDTIQNKEYVFLKDSIESVIAKKVANKIQDRKMDILDKLNGRKTTTEE